MRLAAALLCAALVLGAPASAQLVGRAFSFVPDDRPGACTYPAGSSASWGVAGEVALSPNSSLALGVRTGWHASRDLANTSRAPLHCLPAPPARGPRTSTPARRGCLRPHASLQLLHADLAPGRLRHVPGSDVGVRQ